MTKKYLIQMADYIRIEIAPSDKRAARHAAQMVCFVARQNNPRFDAERFYRACGLEVR